MEAIVAAVKVAATAFFKSNDGLGGVTLDLDSIIRHHNKDERSQQCNIVANDIFRAYKGIFRNLLKNIYSRGATYAVAEPCRAKQIARMIEAFFILV